MKQYKDSFTQIEKEYGLPQGILYAIAMKESSGKVMAKAGGDSTAKGLFQINNATAKQWNVDPWNPETAARATAAQLKRAFDKFGSWDKAIVAHKEGVTGVANGRHDEDYLQKVRAFQNQPWGENNSVVTETPRFKVVKSSDIKPKPAAEQETVSPLGGDWENLAAGFGSGLFNVYRGVKQTGLGLADATLEAAGVEGDFRNKVRKSRQENQEDIDEAARLEKALTDTKAGFTGNLAGNIAPAILIPGGGGLTAARAIGAGAVQGAANAAISSRTSDQDPSSFWLTNMIGGAGGNLVLNRAAKATNAIRGKWRDFKSDAAIAPPPVAYETTKAAGIPSTIGDIDPRSLWHRWEDFSAGIPLSGRKAFMGKQAEAWSKKVGEQTDDLSAKVISSHPTFDDPGKVLYDSIRKEHQLRRAEANKLFDVVDTAAKQAGTTHVEPKATIAILRSIQSEYGDLLGKFGDKRLTDAMSYLDNMGNPKYIEKYGPPTFDKMRKLRTLMNTKIRQAEKLEKRGEIDGDQFRAINQLRMGIEQDIQEWATNNKQNADVFDKFITASEYYKNKIDPFKRDPMLADIRLNPDHAAYDYDKILQRVSGYDRPHTANAILDNVTPEGKEAAAFHLFQKAAKAGLDPDVTGGVSIKSFLNALDTGRTKEAVFDYPTLNKIDDLAISSRAVKRAQDYAKDSALSARATPSVIMGTALGVAPSTIGLVSGGIPGAGVGAAVGAGVFGGLRLANKYTGSDFGKRMYLASQKIPEPFKIPFTKDDPELLRGILRAYPYLLGDLASGE